MKIVITLATALAIAVAKPELYKEKEDFQYSRSSSDDGTKSGFYGAQRGNMGGNYERAHNMDSLAQNQMSGLVKQVDGELGDASNARTGAVFAAANSRGIYGSGNYDLSNLQGRNFREGTSYTDAKSALHNTNYIYAQQNTGYHNSQAKHSEQLQLNHNYKENADEVLATDNFNSGNYGLSHGQSSRYNKQSGYTSEAGYHGTNYAQSNSNLYGSNGYGSNIKSRLVSTTPVRVVVRPGGGRVAIPVAAQTYDASQVDRSFYDATKVNSEAADLNSIDSDGIKPSAGKHYESSYKYHKEWEKHDTKPVAVPLAVPTESSITTDDRQSHSDYSVKSASHNQRQSNNNAFGSNAYNSDYYKLSSDQLAKANQNAFTEVLGNDKPNEYQSSYSYHKSWERQGDPYVIQPLPNSVNNQASQRIVSTASNNRLHSSNQYYQNVDCECDDDDQHLRVARSISQEQETQNLEEFGQQSQNIMDFDGQKSQNLMAYGQQSQNLEDFGQQSQNLEDFGQQSQNLENFGQQSQNLEDFGQYSQNLDDFGQKAQNLENLGQEAQNLESFGQQAQNLEHFGHQSQNLEDFGQQNQNLEDLSQQTQKQWNELGQLGQDHYRRRRDRPGSEKFKELDRKTQDDWQNFKMQGNWAEKDSLRQKTENNWKNAKNHHRRRRENANDWQKFRDLGQQTRNNWHDFRKEGKWENAEALRNETAREWQDTRMKYGNDSHHDHNKHNDHRDHEHHDHHNHEHHDHHDHEHHNHHDHEHHNHHDPENQDTLGQNNLNNVKKEEIHERRRRDDELGQDHYRRRRDRQGHDHEHHDRHNHEHHDHYDHEHHDHHDHKHHNHHDPETEDNLGQNNLNMKKEEIRRRRDDNWEKFRDLGVKTGTDWKNFRQEGNWENAEAMRQKTAKEWQDTRTLYGNRNHEHHKNHEQH